MSGDVAKVLNVVGVALILGMLLRYSSETQKLVETTGGQLSNLYQTVSLQNVRSN